MFFNMSCREEDVTKQHVLKKANIMIEIPNPRAGVWPGAFGYGGNVPQHSLSVCRAGGLREGTRIL